MRITLNNGMSYKAEKDGTVTITNTRKMKSKKTNNKEKMLITKHNDGLWGVEVYDKYGRWTSVCEETIDACREYAIDFQKNADARKAKDDSWGKCVKEMIKNDRKKGLSWE